MHAHPPTIHGKRRHEHTPRTQVQPQLQAQMRPRKTCHWQLVCVCTRGNCNCQRTMCTGHTPPPPYCTHQLQSECKHACCINLMVLGGGSCAHNHPHRCTPAVATTAAAATAHGTAHCMHVHSRWRATGLQVSAKSWHDCDPRPPAGPTKAPIQCGVEAQVLNAAVRCLHPPRRSTIKGFFTQLWVQQAGGRRLPELHRRRHRSRNTSARPSVIVVDHLQATAV